MREFELVLDDEAFAALAADEAHENGEAQDDGPEHAAGGEANTLRGGDALKVKGMHQRGRGKTHDAAKKELQRDQPKQVRAPEAPYGEDPQHRVEAADDSVGQHSQHGHGAVAHQIGIEARIEEEQEGTQEQDPEAAKGDGSKAFVPVA